MTTIKQVSDKIKESVGKVFKGDEKQPSDGIIVYVNANSGELVGASTLN